MKLALTEVYEVATFYAHFDVVKEGETPPPAVTVRVCDSLSCAMAGAEHLLREPAEQARPRRARACARPAWAPATARRSAPSATSRSCRRPRTGSRPRSATAPMRTPTPRRHDFDAYVRDGGYALLKACVAGARTRDDIIKAVSDAGLRGLGGAGFPTGRKWTLVRAEPAPRLMAVNADEGEPGTFKDRTISNAIRTASSKAC